MQPKLLGLLFVTAILAASIAVSVIPVANALTVRTDFSDRHTTASWGNSRVCGDHICAPGEKTSWLEKISELQRVGHGKVGNATNYVQALENIKLTYPTSNHAMTTSEHISVTGNATKAENSTKGTK